MTGIILKKHEDMKARIEILNTKTGLPVQCSSVKDMIDVFLTGNIINYYIVTNERPLTFDVKNRIENGTAALNFIFDTADRSIQEEVEFMKTRIVELQKSAPGWFDKRTKLFKNAYSFKNGFNTPLIFKEIK